MGTWLTGPRAAFWDAQIANDRSSVPNLPLEDRNRIGIEDFVKAS